MAIWAYGTGAFQVPTLSLEAAANDLSRHFSLKRFRSQHHVVADKGRQVEKLLLTTLDHCKPIPNQQVLQVSSS